VKKSRASLNFGIYGIIFSKEKAWNRSMNCRLGAQCQSMGAVHGSLHLDQRGPFNW
jgi:hypothetical protein